MRQRASSYGALIRAENGVGNALKLVKQYLDEPAMGEIEENR
jgi:hypothetical protein